MYIIRERAVIRRPLPAANAGGKGVLAEERPLLAFGLSIIPITISINLEIFGVSRLDLVECLVESSSRILLTMREGMKKLGSQFRSAEFSVENS